MTRTAWWAVLALAGAAWGQGKPELRIDPGTHTSGAQAVCVFGGDRYAATRSGNTVKIWDLRSGAVLRTLWLQVSQCRRSLAVSPDGRWLAASTTNDLVALYETGTWRLVRTLLVPQAAPQLAFAPAQPTLAAGSWDGSLTLFSVPDGAALRRYGPPVPGPNNRATVDSLAWSPDGQQIATVHPTAVVVRSLATGAARVLADSGSTDSGLAWFRDNRRVVVLRQLGSSGPIRVWDTSTGAKLVDFTSDSTGLNLVLSADEREIYGADGGNGALVHSLDTGKLTRRLQFGRQCGYLAVGQDGRTLVAARNDGGLVVGDAVRDDVRLTVPGAGATIFGAGWRQTDGAIGWGWQAKAWPNPPDSPIVAWLDTKSLRAGPTQVSDLWQRPVWKSPQGEIHFTGALDLSVTNPAPGAQPDTFGHCSSATWLSNGLMVANRGTEPMGIRVFRPRGGEITKSLFAADPCYVLAESPDGRYLLGGSSSLYVWPLTANGDWIPPLLSIYPAKDGNWIAWTDEGYYACTPAAEKWIGWQINRGEDTEPDYYPAAQFREQFYRPDVIMRLLDAGSVGEAVRQADATRKQPTDATKVAARIAEFAPPRVEILSPAHGAVVATSEVALRLRVKDPNNRKVVSVIPLVNGRPLTGGRFVLVPSRDPGEQQLTVPLNPGENTLSAIATNDAGSTSVPVSVTVRYGAEEQKPAMYVLAVGVSDYAIKEYTLRYAAKDATDLANVLKQQAGKLFRKVDVKLLTDKEASQGGVLDALDWLTKQVTQRDYAVVFLAGHGLADSAGEYYFLPADGDTERLRRTGLHWSQFRTALRALPGKVLLALDTCHSAGATGARKAGARLDYTNVLRDALSDEVGLITLSSCMPSEVSYEQDEWHNGAFTKALVEALSGQADHNGDGVVTLAELDAYISERVKALTKGRQHATCERPATVRSVLPVAMVK